MSYNGSGVFSINTTGQPVVTGTVISAPAFNALTADLATGLSTAITKDGQTTTAVAIPFAAGITSTTGTFSGALTATTGTFSGALTATGGITVSGGSAVTNTWQGSSGSSLPVTALAAATGANRYLVTVTFKGFLYNQNGTVITPAITITLKDGAGGSTIGTPCTYSKNVAIGYYNQIVVSLSQMVSQPTNNGIQASITDTEGDGGAHSWSDIDVQISVCNMQLG